jgi:hypothetical protein
MQVPERCLAYNLIRCIVGERDNSSQGLFEVPKPEFDPATFSMSRERKKSRASSLKHDMNNSVPQEFGAGLGPNLMDFQTRRLSSVNFDIISQNSS